MLKTLSKLNTCVYYWNSVENTPNNYGKRFPPLLRVFPVTPTVVNYSVGNGFYDAFPGNSSTQNELKSKKTILYKLGNYHQTCYFWETFCLYLKIGILWVQQILCYNVTI